jgi:tetratricopeptide (TPR) repeat protein
MFTKNKLYENLSGLVRRRLMLLTQRTIERRVATVLLAAIILLAATILIRLVSDAWRPLPVSIPPAPPPVALSSLEMVSQLQTRLGQNPENANLYAQLGLAYLQRARESGDPVFYGLAEKSLSAALEREPQQLDALIGMGILALARHDFTTALDWAEQAQAINPYRAQILGIQVDALIELGRYNDAAATLQTMVDLRPDLASYSRVAYLRELHGDTTGAIVAMQRAVEAGLPGSESMLWTQTQLGHLYFNSGQFQQAEAAYHKALHLDPGYLHALAGMARVQAATGEDEAAIALYEQVVETLPWPEYVIALGDLYALTGEIDEAARQYDLVRLMQRLNAAAGVDVDLELALFDLEHSTNPAQTLQAAQAVYQRRPSLYAADVLAWALYHNGRYDDAWAYSQEALRLGTQDALLYYHAGVIAYALGEAAAAQTHLQQALALNPAFSLRHATQAQAILAELAIDKGDAKK